MGLIGRLKRIKGISGDLVPLFLLLVATAWVGFFLVLILRLNALLWLVGLIAAGCMGAGMVYFAIISRSEREEVEEALVKQRNPLATDDELRQALGRDKEGGRKGGHPNPLTERHLEHLIQGIALGYLVSKKSPETLGLPPDIRDRVHASIRRHAQGNNIDPASARALWSWLMKEGLGDGVNNNGSSPPQGEEDGYLEYVVQGLLLSYLIGRKSPGTPEMPQDMLQRLLWQIRDRAVAQDRNPTTAAALWSWLVREGIVAAGQTSQEVDRPQDLGKKK